MLVDLNTLTKEGRCTICLHRIAKMLNDDEFRELMDYPKDVDEKQIRDAVHELVPETKTNLVSRTAVRDALIAQNRSDAERLGLVPLF